MKEDDITSGEPEEVPSPEPESPVGAAETAEPTETTEASEPAGFVEPAGPVEAPPGEVAPPVKQPPTFWMRAWRWLLGFLVVFGLGAVLAIWALYLPARQRIYTTEADLQAANQQLSQLESQSNQKIKELQDKIDSLSALEATNKDLQAQLDQANLHATILSARADVAAAQLALVMKDPTKANIALSKTPQTLDTLKNMLASNQQKAVTDMQARLELASSEIDKNDYAAQSDLDVLSTSLIELENAFFTNQ